MLKGSQWKADDFDWVNMARRLRLFNNDILVAIWVGPDGKDSDDYIVQVEHFSDTVQLVIFHS